MMSHDLVEELYKELWDLIDTDAPKEMIKKVLDNIISLESKNGKSI